MAQNTNENTIHYFPKCPEGVKQFLDEKLMPVFG